MNKILFAEQSAVLFCTAARVDVPCAASPGSCVWVVWCVLGGCFGGLFLRSDGSASISVIFFALLPAPATLRYTIAGAQEHNTIAMWMSMLLAAVSHQYLLGSSSRESTR